MLARFYNRLLNKKTRTFQLAVGEEGVVVLLCESGTVRSRLFLTSPEDKEVEKLKTLLMTNQDAGIHIYVDNLDQSYVQRTLAGVSQFNIKRLAQARLNREIPRNYLKACVQLGRSASGRRDWLYTFVSTPLEPPISTWLDFFLPFPNIIKGIYFMPIEIYTVVEELKEKMALKVDNADVKRKFKKLLSLKIKFKRKATPGEIRHSRWELFISQNKTGGFRQVAFQDGNIVFSRMLNNIQSDSVEVVAGNLELEIANSVEYLTRLSIGIEEEIDIYVILSNDILKAIRTEKLKASRAYMYSPYLVAQLLGLVEASGEKDKFADPALLAAFSKHQKKRVKMHTIVTAKIDLQTSIVDIVSAMLNITLPIIIMVILSILLVLFNVTLDTKIVRRSIASHSSILEDSNHLLKDIESKLGGKFSMEQLNEILELHKFMVATKVDPMVFINKISKILPDFAKIKEFSWVYNDPILFDFKSSPNLKPLNELTKQRNYVIESEISIPISNKIQSIEELNQQYNNLEKSIKTNFPEYKVEISDLPTSFSFQEVGNTVNIKIKLSYNSLKKLGLAEQSIPEVRYGSETQLPHVSKTLLPPNTTNNTVTKSDESK